MVYRSNQVLANTLQYTTNAQCHKHIHVNVYVHARLLLTDSLSITQWTKQCPSTNNNESQIMQYNK